jgi:hypothetical protein
LSGSFFCQTPLIVGVKIFTRHGGGGLNYQTSNFSFQLRQHSGVVRGGSFARFGNDLVRR